MSLSDQQWCPTSVQVTVLQARDLRIKGKSGTNDAYAVMQVGKEKYQTSVVEKSVSPVWKEEASFDLPPLLLQGGGGGGGGKERGTLHVHVLHRALVGPDKLLGQAVINLLQLSEDKTRNKTEWFRLLDKTGKPDKERGEVLLDIQFMRNNMTASMFDLSAAGKSRSRLGKLKDKVRGKKKELDSSTGVVPSLTQVLTDSEEEDASGRGEGGAGKDGKTKPHKRMSLFSPKSNLQRNMSQSLSVLPAKNSSLSGSQSSGLNVDSSEGKKKFKFKIHKHSSSSDSKDSSSGQLKQEQSNLCINGSHIYCEEPPPWTSRTGSSFSLSSSRHGSMEDVPENTSPSVNSLKAVKEISPWIEEDEEKEDEEGEEEDENIEDLRKEEEEEEKAKLEKDLRKQKEEAIGKQQGELERLAEEKLGQDEEEKVRKEEEERQRLVEEKKRLEEQERRKLDVEEERRREEEERLKKEEKRAQERRQEEERKFAEEKMRLKEEERKIEEEKVRRDQERAEEERRKKELEEKRQREEEERLKKEEMRIEEEKKAIREKEHARLMEEERREEERIEAEEKFRKAEKERKRKEHEETLAKRKELEEQERRKEEQRLRRHELDRLAKQKLMQEEEERRKVEEEQARREEERIQKEKIRREEEEERKRRQEELERLAKEKLRQEEERKKVKEEQARREEERIQEEERKRVQEELERLAKEKLRQEEEERRKVEERARREEAERILKEKIKEDEERKKKDEEERKRRQEELERLAEEKLRQEEEERRKVEEERAKIEEEDRIQKEKMRREEEKKARKERMEEEMREEKRKEEEERIKKEEQEKFKKEEGKREEEERIKEEKWRAEERRIEEEKVRRQEEERIRREEEERKQEKLTKEKRENKIKEEQKSVGTKLKHRVPAEITSTNPFDENFSPEETSTSSKASTDDQRNPSAVSSVERGAVSTNERDPINVQRDKRAAPKPPGRNPPERHKEEETSAQHMSQINKQSKDKNVKTVSVAPQRSVQMIAPLNRSSKDLKNTERVAEDDSTKEATTKHNKGPAPAIPGTAEDKLHRDVLEMKEDIAVYGLNPFEDNNDDDDDENDLTVHDDAISCGKTDPVHWPAVKSQTADKDATKIKSSKIARAPLPPAQNDTPSSSMISQNHKESKVSDDIRATSPIKVCNPQEVKTHVQVQESPNKESKQIVTVAAVKEEGPPASSRRLQPVKPLNPLEQQSDSVVKVGNDNKATGLDCNGVQHKTNVATGRAGPYSQLTREELIALLLKRERQLSEKDKKISELERYIDNLLVRVIEEKPSILMSMSSLKKAA